MNLQRFQTLTTMVYFISHFNKIVNKKTKFDFNLIILKNIILKQLYDNRFFYTQINIFS